MLTKGFPESYIPYLTALHEEHPFWQFEPILVTEMQPTYTFEYIISREDTPGPNPSNLVTTDSWAPQPWTSLGQANYTPYYDESDTALYDSGWRKASNAAVRYFMDPRNFLNDVDIFMFEDLSFFNAETQTVELVNDALASSFMGNYAMCDNGITYAQHLYNCAKTYNVNAITLANRLVLEQGLGTSPLVNGTLGTTLAGYYAAREENADDDRIWGDYTPEDVFDEEELLSFDGYYNFFNTGASGNGYFAIYYNAAQESIENGWDTKAKAIEGGAAKLALNMIQDYQYTIYLQKFNVDPRSDSNFWGQYMQNISAPLTEGRNARATYKNGGVLERGYTFRIPVYDGLPETASADPANGNSRYSSSVSTGADWGTQTYSLTASVAEGQGTVHFGSGETSSQILPGTTVNVQVTPAANYAVSQVLIGGKTQSILNDGGEAVYSFLMPVNSCTVQVSFTWVGPPLYTVSAVVGGGEGTVHFGGGSTSAEVTEGTIINFQTTPASGYKVSEIWVGDSFFVPINNGADAVYQFSMPAADYEVRAVFTPLDTVSYRVRCGTFMTIEQAVELMDLLAEQEISAYIGTVNGQYIVYAGIYEAKDAANEAVRQITAKGFGAYVSTT